MRKEFLNLMVNMGKKLHAAVVLISVIAMRLRPAMNSRRLKDKGPSEDGVTPGWDLLSFWLRVGSISALS